MKAPFPYPGGKSRVADIVWKALGDVDNYVEPFSGSLAVLLARPESHRGRVETVNDLNGFIANFWRAVKADPSAVVAACDYPTLHVDLHARQRWLVERHGLLTELLKDPDYYDAKAAGWWAWGLSNWIGSGWCEETAVNDEGDAGKGVAAKRPHLGNAGQGVAATRPHLGNAGQGVAATRPHLGDAGKGVTNTYGDPSHTHMLDTWFMQLAQRLRHVRVLNSDWSRLTRGALKYGNIKGIFLDPPYDQATLAARSDLYSGHHSSSVSTEVRQWALEIGQDSNHRVILAGFEDEHGPHMPSDWTVMAWSSTGMQSTKTSRSNQTRHKERLWFSPHCLREEQQTLI